jgi:demethylmenaquinone methyltransferase/2-methoxy-6-polyprenyl-1,4-benzoquinol methylase
MTQPLKTKDLSPPYARFLSPLVRPFPDFDFSFIKPVRKKAVELLELKAGDRAIDAGCGSGGSFPYLVEAVGPTGSVSGIEIDHGTCVNTRRRIARNKWENVELIEAPAQEAKLAGSFDGLLMFAAPDVYASKAALGNIFPHLRPGARVAFFGAKISDRRSGWLLNGLLRKVFTAASPKSPGLDQTPWRLMEPLLEDIKIKEYFFGWMFLASGRVRPI